MFKKRAALATLGALVVAYLAMGLYFWGTQEQAIFKPLQQIAQTPADLDPPLKFDAVEIPTQQSAIHGYWLPTDKNAPVALYLHGQDATVGKNLDHAQCLNQLGCNVLVIDYRGYGATFGTLTPSESSVNHDAGVAWTYLTETLGIAAERILIYGHSLGGAIAIELASNHPQAGGLIVESSFTSVKQIARWKFAVTYLLPLDSLLRHRFDSIDKVQKKPLPPVLFLHGTADTKVPTFMCKQLFDAAQGSDKEMLLIEGGEHAKHGEGQSAYEERVSAFLGRNFGPNSTAEAQP